MKGIGWFSGGVTSSVAIKKVLEKNINLDIFFFETGMHHPDTARFLKDCEKWFGTKIQIIKNKKYKSVLDIFRKGFLNSPNGANCTKLMKKEMRIVVEKIVEFDFQIFGFEYEESQVNRAIRFNQQYPESKAIYPLIDLKINKRDCFKILTNEGIEIPTMYKLGYSNNNCIGCVKGGVGYWNKIRKDFPEVFNEMATIERQTGATCLKKQYKKNNKVIRSHKLFLDEIDPNSGRFESISLPECGVVCPVEMDGLNTLPLEKSYLVQSSIFSSDLL